MFLAKPPHHRQALTPVALAAAVVFLAALALAMPPKRPEVVSLYLTVEQGNKLIRGLKQENFRLQEAGATREFHLEEPEKPLSIALLVEYSEGSYIYFDDIQYAMQGFVKAAPEGNWYALATFSHGMELRVDFTQQIGELMTAFSALPMPSWNETDTYDALHELLDRLGRLPGRRVLIFVGSGRDSLSEYTLGAVQTKVQGANVVVYGVGAGSLLRGRYEPYLSSSARMSLLQAQSFIQMLADESGGEAWFPKFDTAFPDVLKGIMQSLDCQYRLVYQPRVPADGKFHKIKVEAFQVTNDRRTNFKVRVRKGWRF